MDAAFAVAACFVLATGIAAFATVCRIIVKHGAGFAAFNLGRNTFYGAGFAIAFAADASDAITTSISALATVERIVLEVDAIIGSTFIAVWRNLNVLTFAIHTGLIFGTFVIAVTCASTGSFIAASCKAEHTRNRNTHQFEFVFFHGLSLKKVNNTNEKGGAL